MNYKAITTPKKSDTEGRIPEYTLGQYVRSKLSRKVALAYRPDRSARGSRLFGESGNG